MIGRGDTKRGKWQPTWEALDRVAENFWERVDQPPEGCWLWQAGKDNYGYGNVRVGGVLCRTQVVSYALTHDLWPDRDVFPKELILHKCDVPSCVRPDHLYVGTYEDNMQDRKRRGRNTREAWAVMNVPRTHRERRAA